MATLADAALALGRHNISSSSFNLTTTIDGVDETDMPTILALRDVWIEKYPGNLLRSLYYSAKNRYKDFGMSVPPVIARRVRPMIGWAAKSVRTLADLSAFEGFVVEGEDRYEINKIAACNHLDTVVGQTIVSAYTHSCAFITVDLDSAGRVRLTPRAADWSAAIWDASRNQIAAALTISSVDSDGKVDEFSVWLAHCSYECKRTHTAWSAVKREHNLGRPTVVAFSYDPQLNRPFGRSRISGPLMSLIDIGVRTIVRMESTAEFYSAPKLWFLGVSPDTFDQNLWKSLVSVINTVSADVDGNEPKLQQVQQASMQPHSDMLKTIAMLVASETSLPVNDLGITMDNPASAEAMAAAERKLSREADRQNRLFGSAIKDAIGMGIQLAHHLDDIPDELQDAHVVWAPTREISDAARADYYAKIAAVNPSFADSDVGLLKAGLTYSEIQSLRASQQAARARQMIDKLHEQINNTAKPENSSQGGEPTTEE